MLFEVLIIDMMVICGANENESIGLGRVRLGYNVFYFYLPQKRIPSLESAHQITKESTKFMHEMELRPQLQIY